MIYNIFFIGLNNETLLILKENLSLKILGVNYFDYFNIFTFNPIDQFFRFAYNFYYKKRKKVLYLMFLRIWNFFSSFSNKIYRENKEYLNYILLNNINVIDVENKDLFSTFLLKNKIDLLVINSWSILPNELLNLPKYKTLNIHPSLLPQYRGSLPTLWSLKNNDKLSGVTFLILNESIDDGLIIRQYPFEIENKDDWFSLEQKVSLILKNHLNKDIIDYFNKKYIEIKNNFEVSFTDKYNKYREIKLSKENNKDIYNKVGLYPFIEPFCYCFIYILGKKIHLKNINYFLNKGENIKLDIGKIDVKFLYVLFYSIDGILKACLFKDISFKDSIFIIFNKLINKI